MLFRSDHDGTNRYGVAVCKVAMLPEPLVRKYYDAGLLEIDDWEWTITPNAGHANYVRNVRSDGSLSHNYAYNGNHGVRPAFFVDSEICLSLDQEEIELSDEALLLSLIHIYGRQGSRSNSTKLYTIPGEPCRAPANGVVVLAAELALTGNTVVIDLSLIHI